MIQSNPGVALPFYESEIYLNNNKWWAYGQIYPLYVRWSTLAQFQIKRSTSTYEIRYIYLRNIDGSLKMDLTSSMKPHINIIRYQSLGYDLLVLDDSFQDISLPHSGQYYLEISDPIHTWYSEIITLTDSINCLTMIEWYNLDDQPYEGGHVQYGGLNYSNRYYIKADIGKPDYTFTIEGEEIDGFFMPEKKISQKEFKFTFLAPEYLIDSLRFACIADVVYISSNYYGYNCNTFEFEIEWQEGGALARVDVTFTTDYAVKNIGKAVQP